MCHCSCSRPDFAVYDFRGRPLRLPCYTILVHYAPGGGEDEEHPERQDRFFVEPRLKRVPLPRAGFSPVTICWRLAHPALSWDDVGVVMKPNQGWGNWGQLRPGLEETRTRELVVDAGPGNKVKYPYTLHLAVEGVGNVTIDPEIEYDEDLP